MNLINIIKQYPNKKKHEMLKRGRDSQKNKIKYWLG